MRAGAGAACHFLLCHVPCSHAWTTSPWAGSRPSPTSRATPSRTLMCRASCHMMAVHGPQGPPRLGHTPPTPAAAGLQQLQNLVPPRHAAHPHHCPSGWSRTDRCAGGGLQGMCGSMSWAQLAAGAVWCAGLCPQTRLGSVALLCCTLKSVLESQHNRPSCTGRGQRHQGSCRGQHMWQGPAGRPENVAAAAAAAQHAAGKSALA